MTETITVWHDRKLYRVDARLSRTEARALLDEKHPVLVRPADRPCPFEVGEVLTIIPHRLWIEVSQVKRTKHGTWRIDYLLCDHRPQFLRRHSGTTDDPQRALRTQRRREDGIAETEPERMDVGSDWEDKGMAEREKQRQEAREEAERERRMESARRRLGHVLKGLSPEAQKTMLAEIERICERHEASDDVRDAA